MTEPAPLASGALLAVLTFGAVRALCPDAPDLRATPVFVERVAAAGCGFDAPAAVGESHIGLVFEPHAPEVSAEGRGDFAAAKRVTVDVAPNSRIRLGVPETVARVEDAARMPYFCPALEHEIGHVTLAYRFAAENTRTVVGRGPTADAAARAAEAAAAAARAKATHDFRALEDTYDRVSEHGIAQTRAAAPFGLPATPDIPPCVRR